MDDLALEHLLATIKAVESNVIFLHWNSVRLNFDTLYKLTGEQYEQFANDDVVAEMSLRVGDNPINYSASYKLLEPIKNIKLVIMDYTNSYGAREIA